MSPSHGKNRGLIIYSGDRVMQVVRWLMLLRDDLLVGLLSDCDVVIGVYHMVVKVWMLIKNDVVILCDGHLGCCHDITDIWGINRNCTR